MYTIQTLTGHQFFQQWEVIPKTKLVGTAPDASYLFITEDVRSENPVEESLWVEAAEKADSLGVDIIIHLRLFRVR
jgi:hypothetical protein